MSWRHLQANYSHLKTTTVNAASHTIAPHSHTGVVMHLIVIKVKYKDYYIKKIRVLVSSRHSFSYCIELSAVILRITAEVSQIAVV